MEGLVLFAPLYPADTVPDAMPFYAVKPFRGSLPMALPVPPFESATARAQRLWARVRLCIQSAGRMLKSAHLLDQRWLGSRMALIAFAIGTACTAYIAYLTDREISASSAVRLAQLAERTRKTIVDRMTHDEDMLNGLAGMVNGRPTFTREEVRRYVATMPVRELSGALGYGFIRYLPRSGIDNFLAKLSMDGIPEFEIKSSGNALDLFVIEIIEPYLPNAAARGFDIGSEAKRRAAATSSVTLTVAMTGVCVRAATRPKTAGAWPLRLSPYRTRAAITIWISAPLTTASRAMADITVPLSPVNRW